MAEGENATLIKIPSLEEIKESIWQLHPLKSLGHNGFLGIFYRFYWNIIQDKIVRCVQDCFRYGRNADNMNNSFIVLIPKIQ